MKLKVLSSIRTNNFNDPEIMNKIKELWKEASFKLENNNKSTYGVYHGYESDYQGDYSLSVCVKESDSDDIELPENENYNVFRVDSSDEQGILKAWEHIWKLEEAGELKRAYTYDFEKYYPNGDVEINIAVKE
ncbi:effector binding domain-containing protein [Pseudogracilibacillus sp. SE30717A]|uniref:GyrI-like domain-containing protein n=1 Tax=Pseudogracilibacillus sp. SE30717A TaxID=3098293 RepID=UPI00300E5B22